MPAVPPPPSPVKSAMRTLDLIEYVVARPSGTVAQELSDALAIPVSSLSYLLATLVERGYLNRTGRRYVAGPGLDRLRRQNLSLVERARPLVKALQQRVNETSSLFQPVGWAMEAIVTETAEQALRYSIDVGMRVPFHHLSAGKAFLAALPDGEIDRYLAESHGERSTSGARFGVEAMRAEIATTRAAGYARTTDAFTAGISGIGVAVLEAGRPVAALSVAVPTSRFDSAKEGAIVERLRQTARTLEDGAPATRTDDPAPRRPDNPG